MRPLKLTMRAFGPYADEQVVDFSELKGRNFFLIHGPTGAGKTTILDAICFALYGDTSGDERIGRQMRSDHATLINHTEVTFDFVLGKDVYRVTRIPEQEKVSGKRNASVMMRAQATLWRLMPGDIEGTFKTAVLATKTNEVNAKIEELLGFKSEQFRQVVLLPQGKFRQLIVAGSSDREEILETLFKTEIYKRIEDALKAKASGVGDLIREQQARRDLILEQGGGTACDELEERKVTLEAQLASVGDRLVGLRLQEESAHKLVTEARHTMEKLNELQLSDRSNAHLAEMQPAFGEKQKILEAARKGETVVPIEAALRSRRGDLDDIRQRLVELNASVVAANSEKTEADHVLELGNAKQKDREEAERNLAKLQEWLTKVSQLDAVRAQLDAAETNMKTATDVKAASQKMLLDVQSKQDALSARKQQLEVASAKRESLAKALSDAEQLVEFCRKLNAVSAQVGSLKKEHEEIDTCVGALGTRVAESKGELQVLESAFSNAQAAVLAKQLKDGEPCSVCGSMDHPQPAKFDGQLPTEAFLKTKREEIKQLEANHQSMSADERQKHSLLVKLETEQSGLLERLGVSSGVNLDLLVERVQQAKSVLAEAEKAVPELERINSELSKLVAMSARVKDQLSQVEASFTEALSAKEHAAATLKERLSEVPEHLADAEILKKKCTETELRIKQFKEMMAQAQERARLAAEKFAAVHAAQNAAEDNQLVAQERLAKQEVEFADALAKAGFANREEFLAQRLSPENIKVLDGEISEYLSSLKAAQERLERARAQAAGLVAPDTEVLENGYRAAKAEVEVAVREEADLAQQIKQMRTWLDELRRISAEISKLDEHYGVVGRLAEVASGKNSLGVTFQRFVLGALLDDVLIAASDRMRIMSKGRYHMQRMRSRTDMRKAGGLDLEVFDSYTGTTRPVATLSGGESFIASLSMALGLADVVQAYSGGMYLETIFVDEGFGSLDPESLDLALRALIDLQQGGRMVGIISHVPELKERIDARLEVIPGRTGSSARFVVA